MVQRLVQGTVQRLVLVQSLVQRLFLVVDFILVMEHGAGAHV